MGKKSVKRFQIQSKIMDFYLTMVEVGVESEWTEWTVVMVEWTDQIVSVCCSVVVRDKVGPEPHSSMVTVACRVKYINLFTNYF